MAVVTRKRSAQIAALEQRKARNVKPRQAPRQQPRLVKHQKSKAPPIFAPPEKLFTADIWTCIVSFLGAVDLANLALVSRFFVPIVKDDRVWKSLCLRHLRIPGVVTISPQFTWKHLYISVFEQVHYFDTHDRSKHIDWLRMGVFTMSSGKALAAGRLWQPTVKQSGDTALCFIPNVQRGIWIADLHLLRCPICSLPACEGTSQVIEARNWELYHHKEYQEGAWQYEQVACKGVAEKLDAAAGGVFDYERLVNKEITNSDLLNFKLWVSGSQPRTCVSPFAAAASTPLGADNRGIVVKISTMRAGKDGPVMAIQIAQQLK